MCVWHLTQFRQFEPPSLRIQAPRISAFTARRLKLWGSRRKSWNSVFQDCRLEAYFNNTAPPSNTDERRRVVFNVRVIVTHSYTSDRREKYYSTMFAPLPLATSFYHWEFISSSIRKISLQKERAQFSSLAFFLKDPPVRNFLRPFEREVTIRLFHHARRKKTD